MNNMTTTTRPASSTVSLSGAFNSLSQSLTVFGTVLMTWNRRHDQRARLAKMPDHLLSDMGISRADADLEASKPFWQR